MELKFATLAAVPPPTAGSNRTFMELKSYLSKSTVEHLEVLIAPLWN